jgi:hypothetical protein
MEDLSYKLIKNGIQALVEEEEQYFKKNIVQSLSIKLNDAISDVLTETNKNLFYKHSSLADSPELKTFLSVISKPEKIQLKDNSIINITENEIQLLKGLFENLNTENKKKMIESVFSSPGVFNQHIEFYKKSKGLFR